MSDENTRPGTADADAQPEDEVTTPEADTEAAGEESEPEAEHTYPAEVVRKLRDENAKHRTRAKEAEDRADGLSARLHTELVRATGLLADPSDLPFDAEHLDDADKMAEAIAALVESKPHLKARKPTGTVGQGERGNTAQPFSLLSALRNSV